MNNLIEINWLVLKVPQSFPFYTFFAFLCRAILQDLPPVHAHLSFTIILGHPPPHSHPSISQFIQMHTSIHTTIFTSIPIHLCVSILHQMYLHSLLSNSFINLFTSIWATKKTETKMDAFLLRLSWMRDTILVFSLQYLALETFWVASGRAEGCVFFHISLLGFCAGCYLKMQIWQHLVFHGVLPVES